MSFNWDAWVADLEAREGYHIHHNEEMDSYYNIGIYGEERAIEIGLPYNERMTETHICKDRVAEYKVVERYEDVPEKPGHRHVIKERIELVDEHFGDYTDLHEKCRIANKEFYSWMIGAMRDSGMIQ
jgi:hypothetical protein